MFFYFILLFLFVFINLLFTFFINFLIRSAPVINRKKLKDILSSTFQARKNEINNEIRRNIKQNGSISVTFDLWSSNALNSYIGVIITYINPEFELIYKLIGMFFIIIYY